jgi:hypothetical protein
LKLCKDDPEVSPTLDDPEVSPNLDDPEVSPNLEDPEVSPNLDEYNPDVDGRMDSSTLKAKK